MYLTSNSLAHVVDCSFIRNRDEQEVAALGGAISASASTIRLRRVVFEGNEATDGAAIFAAGSNPFVHERTGEIYNSLLQEEDRQQYFDNETGLGISSLISVRFISNLGRSTVGSSSPFVWNCSAGYWAPQYWVEGRINFTDCSVQAQECYPGYYGTLPNHTTLQCDGLCPAGEPKQNPL